ncbi:hypothetical protein AAG906_016237 [Vitis piasezkii]
MPSFSLICFVIAISHINLAANTAVKVLKRPNQLSPQELKAKFNLFAIKGNSTLHATDSSSHPHTEASESQMASTT